MTTPTIARVTRRPAGDGSAPYEPVDATLESWSEERLTFAFRRQGGEPADEWLSTGCAGTRTASVTGGWVALALAVRRLVAKEGLKENPIVRSIAAVSTATSASPAVSGAGS